MTTRSLTTDNCSLTTDHCPLTTDPWPLTTDNCRSFIQPAFEYHKTAVLMPQDASPQLRAAVGAALSHPRLRSTATQSVDDAATGPQDTRVIAVSWPHPPALSLHFEQFYPRSRLSFTGGLTPLEIAVKLLPPLSDDVALSQRDPRWAHHCFGEDPGSTLGAYGCFVTAAAIALRHVYGTDVTPPLLDHLMVNARHAFVLGNLLDWVGFCSLFSRLIDPVKTNTSPPLSDLARMLPSHVVILRRHDGAHFVCLESVDEPTLLVIDPWTGQRRRWSAEHFAGYRAARILPR